MQIGVSVSTDKFREEIIVLGNRADFIEVVLSGREDASICQGSKSALFAHLADLDRTCFESLELAKCIGVKKAVIHFFTCNPMSFDEKITLLTRLHERAARYNISLCLENTEENTSTLKQIFESIPFLSFCLDIGHANLFSNNPIDFIDVFSERLEHIHVSDNRGGDSEQDDLHLPPGEGTVNFHRVFSALKSKSYDKTMTIELHPRFDVDAKVESLRRLRIDWNRTVINKA
jgi:sugar phosphate isomerase/epimerase